VTPTFIYRALKEQPLQVHGSGESSRDFIYVADVAEGLLRCALADGVEGDVFNLASGVETSIVELARKINHLAGSPVPVEHLPVREWDRSVRRYGSTEKSRRRLGFEAKATLDDGLARTVSWTRENMARVERCIQRHRHHCPVDFQ
jgi:nucleoside-diphosphate-sugar epimerase